MSKVFQSHKKVIPTPMNKAEYCEYRGWKVPSDEDPVEEGYLVEYLDGGKPNHPDHKGYISWTPKPQFDEGYTEVVPEYQQRVITEKNELDEKSKALSNFIGLNDAFDTLSPEEQDRLKEQNDIMWQYSEILGKRIAAF